MLHNLQVLLLYHLHLVCLALLLPVGLCKVNPPKLIGLRQSALLQALCKMGHQTGLIELVGFCLIKKANEELYSS